MAATAMKRIIIVGSPAAIRNFDVWLCFFHQLLLLPELSLNPQLEQKTAFLLFSDPQFEHLFKCTPPVKKIKWGLSYQPENACDTKENCSRDCIGRYAYKKPDSTDY